MGHRVSYPHIWFNPNKKKNSGKKYEKAIKHYKKLQRRIEIEGETKWLKNAIMKIKNKFNKYSITEDMIK